MQTDNDTQLSDFPLGSSIDLDALSRDPYPILARLRESEPVTFVPALNMYLVTRYADVRSILQDDVHFVVGTDASLPYDIFGEHMMTVEAPDHERYKAAHRPFFLPPAIRSKLEQQIEWHANALIDEFANDGEVELRSRFTSRLPVLTMLSLFDLDDDEEPILRQMYNDFEAALSNFTRDPEIRAAGRSSAAAFHELLQRYLDRIAAGRSARAADSLLATLAGAPSEKRLSDDEIRRNALIVFFGGISTVDALIMNLIFSLSQHESVFARVRDDYTLIPRAITETIRWLSPVQSATRHVARKTQLHDVEFRPGDTVNCMLAGANRDPDVFDNPDNFDIERDNSNQHVGFAVGPHHCLGSHLARAEARIALQALLERLPEIRLDPARITGPEGYEFRQPTSAVAVFGAGS